MNGDVTIRPDDLEEISKQMLHVKELKQELAKLVSILTMQARKGIDSEESQDYYDNQPHMSNTSNQQSKI